MTVTMLQDILIHFVGIGTFMFMIGFSVMLVFGFNVKSVKYGR